MHNYLAVIPSTLLSDDYKTYLEKAPTFFIKVDVEKLRDFINKYIKCGDDKETLYMIENGKIVIDVTEKAKTDQSIKRIYKMFQQGFEKAEKVVDEIIKNTYRILMTREQKGWYICCTDKNLSNYLKERLNQNEGIIYSVDEDEHYSDLMVAEDS